MPVPKPCLEAMCPEFALPGRSRRRAHGTERNRAHMADLVRTGKRGTTPGWNRARRRALRRDHWTCVVRGACRERAPRRRRPRQRRARWPGQRLRSVPPPARPPSCGRPGARRSSPGADQTNISGQLSRSDADQERRRGADFWARPGPLNLRRGRVAQVY
jgi:hypothetical protein